MATLEQLEKAFIAADDAGNTEDAAAFAAEIRKLRASALPASSGQKTGVKDITRWMFQPYKDLGNLITEVPTAMVTGLGGMVAGNVMGAASDLYSSATGQPRVGSQVREDVMRSMTYQPRSQIANEALGLIGKGMESEVGKIIQGLPIAGQELPMIARAARQGVPAATELASAKISAPSEKIVKFAQQNPELIEAAKKMRSLGLSADPAQTNPTFSNVAQRAIARPEIVDIKAAEVNLPKVKRILLEEAGIEGNQLTVDAFKTARSEMSRPYDMVRSIGRLNPNPELSVSLRMSAPTPVVGQAKQVKEGTRVVNEVANAIADGEMTASEAVDAIRAYRSQAQNWYKLAEKGDAKRNPTEIAKAYQKVADTLEDYIAANLPPKSQLLDDFLSARQKLAKNYTVERLVDTESGLPKLEAFNSAALSDAPLTGRLADLKTGYRNFPEALQVVSKYGGAMPKTISRATASATAGAGGAMAIGAPPQSGAILGAVTGLLGGRMVANRLVSPSYQAKNLIPNIPGPRQTLPQGFALAPQGMIGSFDLPVTQRPLPELDVPLIPGSERIPPQPTESLVPRAFRSESPLPVLSEDLLPVVDRYIGTDIPIGRVEGRLFDEKRTPLPSLPPMERGLLSLEEPQAPIFRQQGQPEWQKPLGVDFQLKQEVLQRPEIVAPTQAFLGEAIRLRGLIENSSGFWKTRYRDELAALEKKFGDGMRQLGVDNAIDALGLKPLYEYGVKTKLPIEKARGMLEAD